jgi:hypothetical protein
MCTSNTKLETVETFAVKLACGSASTALGLLLLGWLLLVGFKSLGFGQQAGQKTFASAGDAIHALYEATQKADEPALEAILGGGRDITSSSDDEQDKLEREQFSQKYQEMHRLVREPDGSTVLYIGAENWPFPIPLAAKNGQWYFDSDRGQQEILFRRVGENEMTAIEVCEEFALAGNATAAKADSEDPITQFAASLASGGAANVNNNDAKPFHGYYFRIVTDNSAAETDSGSGKKGLKLVAYPAEYRSSGVKTFVVTQKGVVLEKDLGPETKTLAPEMKARSGSSWRRATSS